MQATAGSVSKFIGVLAGAPAALRAYARMRHELRGGVLPRPTRERIALAVAERRADPYSIAQHARTARAAGLGLDEISRARSFNSADPHEEAREIGWSDEEILEAVAHLALNEFQSLIANAAALPHDQTDSRVLPSAA